MAGEDKWCRWRTPFDRERHPLCELGINWPAFRAEGGTNDQPVPGWLERMPCLGRNAEARARCARYEPRPAEEIAAQRENVKLMLVAFTLCAEDVGDRPRPYRGTIRCPKCGGELVYLAKATKKGTIWGTCRTKDCLQWMV